MKPIALDKTAMTDIQRVGVPTTGFPTSPRVDVVNGIGKQLGVIGLVTTAIVTGNRAGAVSDLMAAQSFHPHAYFDAQLDERLRKRGLAIVPEVAEADRQSFLKDYPAIASTDAVLDVYVSTYGFFANSDRDSSPYRPAVDVSMRLVSAADRSILMLDRVVNAGVGASSDEDTGPATPSFPTFGAVRDDPVRAVGALKFALSYAADAIAVRLA